MATSDLQDRANTVFKSACYREGDYTVKNLFSKIELLKAYRLRHHVFCEELGWVLSTPRRIEADAYDDYAVHFGVFDAHDKLVAYLRLIMPTSPFMMEKEFRLLVDPNHVIRKEPDTAEISRLCISPEARKDFVTTDFGKQYISVALLKGIHHWCRLNGIRYLYAVTEDKVYRIARARGFTFDLIGEPRLMPDGISVVVMTIDWDKFEIINQSKRPRLMEWFNQHISASYQTL